MLSISISLVAVFIPILLMGGIVGRLFREFAVTLSRRHPGLAGGLADHDADDVRPPAVEQRQSHGRLYRASEKAFDCISKVYERTLGWVLRHSAAHAAGRRSPRSALNVYLYVIVPKGFFPQQDTGRLSGSIVGRPGHFVPGHASDDMLRMRGHRRRRIPACRAVIAFHRRRRRHDDQHRPLFITLKPLDGAQGRRPTR